MRHIIVTRVSLFLAALFATAAGLFGWWTARVDSPGRTIIDAPAAGQALFEKHCGSCHATTDLRSSLRGVSETRRRELEQFLAHHGDAAPEDDRRILDELAGENPRPP